MRTPLTLLVPLLAVAVAGCGGASSPDLEPVATQAERVGQLLDEARPCEALEAMRALDTLAEETGDTAVTSAVDAFISDARAAVTCGGDPSPSPTPTDDAPPAREDDDGGDPGQGGGGDEDGDDEGGADDEGGDDNEGRGPPDTDDGGPPGRGRGQGNGGRGGP